MRTRTSQPVWTSCARRCASLWMLVAVLSCLLTVPLPAAGSTTRAPAEEESNETPTEEDVVCPVHRDDLLDGQTPPAVKPLVAMPRRVSRQLGWRMARPIEVAGRNGCGGPLRC